VEDLLAVMTADEKPAQLGGVWLGELVTDGAVDEARLLSLGPHGIGEITGTGGTTGLHPEESARFFSEIQSIVTARTRLDFPMLVHEEVIGSYCARDATVFPQALALASTWDTGIVREVAGPVRYQIAAVGVKHALGRVLGVARDPRNLTGGDDSTKRDRAIALARASDVALVLIGGRSGLTLDSTFGKARDATDPRLTGAQEQLILELTATGTPTLADAAALETTPDPTVIGLRVYGALQDRVEPLYG
jgi:hypothetical protein